MNSNHGPYIIPIFINNGGCPNRCIYCNEYITAGPQPEKITKEFFRDSVNRLIPRDDSRLVQIAFYGGNFTGMDEDYQRTLLEYAAPYVRTGLISSIRISTRPDYIDKNIIDLLKNYHVSTVELGAQSMIDEVLAKAERGHTSEDTRRAVSALIDNGIKTGVHLMAGLPGDTEEGFLYTVREIIRLRPDTVRIHPTIVLKGTALAKLYSSGQYRPLSMEEAISLCGKSLRLFREAGIPVIRVGLQPTDELLEEGSVIAGPFHPAFRSLVTSALFRKAAATLLERTSTHNDEVCFTVSSRDVSDFRGQKNSNLSRLRHDCSIQTIKVKEDHLQARYSITLVSEGDKYSINIYNDK